MRKMITWWKESLLVLILCSYSLIIQVLQMFWRLRIVNQSTQHFLHISSIIIYDDTVYDVLVNFEEK